MRFIIPLLVCIVCPSCFGHSFFDVIQDLTGTAEAPPPIEDNRIRGEEAKPYPEPTEEEQAALYAQGLSKNIVTNGVLLRALDKETARVSIIEIPVGEEMSYGSLRIKVDRCEMAPSDRRPESSAFIRISETRTGHGLTELFSGWMFASSPALSALDHPVYDIWVKSCTDLGQVLEPYIPAPAPDAAPETAPPAT